MRPRILRPESFSLIDECICLIDDVPELMREPLWLSAEAGEPQR
jgi:hypothetical protein